MSASHGVTDVPVGGTKQEHYLIVVSTLIPGAIHSTVLRSFHNFRINDPLFPLLCLRNVQMSSSRSATSSGKRPIHNATAGSSRGNKSIVAKEQ